MFRDKRLSISPIEIVLFCTNRVLLNQGLELNCSLLQLSAVGTFFKAAVYIDPVQLRDEPLYGWVGVRTQLLLSPFITHVTVASLCTTMRKTAATTIATAFP